MKINAKKAYYFFVIGIGIISLLITLKILRSYNKPPSIANIKNILGLYTNKLIDNNINFYEKRKIKKDESENLKFNITYNLTQYYYPFKIKFTENLNKKEFSFNYNKEKNELNFINFNLLKEDEFNSTIFPLLQLFSISTNSSKPLNLTLEKNYKKR